VDAKDLLRRYLEQRRELGESELVLDALKVEDVMRLLGAAGEMPMPPHPSHKTGAPLFGRLA
jgi:uracil-DNA glycosylase